VDKSVRVVSAADCAESPEFRVRLIHYPKGFSQSIHTHDHASVTLVLSGTIEEVRDRTTQFATPFTLIVKKAGVPHSDRFEPNGCKTLQISLPEDFDLDDCEIDSSHVIWHTDGGGWITPLLGLMRCIQQAGKLSPLDISQSLYEALGALPSTTQITSTPPVWLRRLRALIDESDAMRPLSMATLQKYAAIHPVHITRQFKRHFGCTVRAYMQYRRVRAAVALVSEGSLTLTEVAHQCAFADQPHFCRAFRAIAGLTARDYRKLIKMAV